MNLDLHVDQTVTGPGDMIFPTLGVLYIFIVLPKISAAKLDGC